MNVLNKIKADLSRSQLHTISRAACQLKIAASKEHAKQLNVTNYQTFEESYTRLIDISRKPDNLQQQLKVFEALLYPQLPSDIDQTDFVPKADSYLTKDIIQQALMWIHLVQVWDYLPAEEV